MFPLLQKGERIQLSAQVYALEGPDVVTTGQTMPNLNMRFGVYAHPGVKHIL